MYRVIIICCVRRTPFIYSISRHTLYTDNTNLMCSIDYTYLYTYLFHTDVILFDKITFFVYKYVARRFTRFSLDSLFRAI